MHLFKCFSTGASSQHLSIGSFEKIGQLRYRTIKGWKRKDQTKVGKKEEKKKKKEKTATKQWGKEVKEIQAISNKEHKKATEQRQFEQEVNQLRTIHACTVD